MTTSRALIVLSSPRSPAPPACGSAPPPPPAGGGKTRGCRHGRLDFRPGAVRRHAARTPEPCKMTARRGLREGAGPIRESDAVIVGADGAVQNDVRVHQGRPRRGLLVRRADVAVDARPEGLPLRTSRAGVRAGQPLEVHQQRRDAAQRARAADERTRTSTRRSRTRTRSMHADVHRAGSDGALQVRRASLDVRVRRRRRASVLRGDGRGRARSRSTACRPAPTSSRRGTRSSARRRTHGDASRSEWHADVTLRHSRRSTPDESVTVRLAPSLRAAARPRHAVCSSPPAAWSRAPTPACRFPTGRRPTATTCSRFR